MNYLFQTFSNKVGEKISACGSLDLHKHKDGYIFQSQNKEYLENIVKRMKTLKHPGFLNCKYENDQILLPDLTPLFKVEMSQELLILGIHQLYQTLKFLHSQQMVHGNITDETVFVVNGEFKLFGLDICSPVANNLLYKANKLAVITQYPSNPDPTTLDAVLLYKLATKLGLGSTINQQDVMRWPDALYDHWLIQLSNGLSNFTILNENERSKVLALIQQHQSNLPKDLCIRVIIDLINAYLYANGSTPVLNTIIQLLPNISHITVLDGPIFDLFATKSINDRTLLLQNIQSFKLFLNELLADKILKLIGDPAHVNPKYREFSMRALVTLSEFTSQKTRDNELIRLVNQYQLDPEPIIRTNSAIGLGKIAPHLSQDVRKRVIPISLMRGLRDPFPPCRAANLTALSVCCLEMNEELCATQLMPIVAPQSVDKDKLVREQAIKCLDALLKRIKEFDPPSPLEQQNEKLQENQSGWGFSISKYMTPTTASGSEVAKSPSLVTIKPQQMPVEQPQQIQQFPIKKNEWQVEWDTEDEQRIPVPTMMVEPIIKKTQAMQLTSNSDKKNEWGWGDDDDLFADQEPVAAAIPVQSVQVVEKPKQAMIPQVVPIAEPKTKDASGWDVDW